MTDGMLGIVPHKTSNKDFLKKGTIPTQDFSVSEGQTSLAWIICSAILLAFTLLITYVIHPQWEKCGVAEWVGYLIDSLIGLSVLLLCIFVLVPLFNGIFADETAAKAGDVDPNATPSGEGNAQKIAVFTGVLAGVAYVARRKPKKTKKAKKAQPTSEELLTKI